MKAFIHCTFYLILVAVCLNAPGWGAIEDACTADSADCLGTVIEADRAYLLVKGEGRLRFRRAPDDRPVLGAILRVSGFGVGRDETCDEDAGLTKSEKDTLEEEEDRWNLGFHIYSLSWCSPSDYIQRNSFVFEKALEVIRAGEMGDPAAPLADDAQLVVIGSSMGGHALARMEAEGTPHGVSLFVSFDAPQLGAYLPISVQYANQFSLTSGDVAGLALFGFPPSLLIRLSDDPRALLLTGMDQPAARQMLLVHYSRFDGAGPHADFTALQEELNGYGFPSAFGMRRVAIANGMSGPTTRDLEGVVFETKRVTFKSASVGAKYKVGTTLLWGAVTDLQFRVPLKLTLTPLTRGGVNQEVFRVDLSNAELRINGLRLLPARVPTLSDIADELGIPDWVPTHLVDDVLDPVLGVVRDFLDDSFLDVENLGIRSRSNAPYGYEAGGGGLAARV